MFATSMYQDMKYELPNLGEQIRTKYQNKTKKVAANAYAKAGENNSIAMQERGTTDITVNTPIENILHMMTKEMAFLTKSVISPELSNIDEQIIAERYKNLVQMHKKAKDLGKLKPEHNLGVLLDQYPELKTYIMKNVSLLDNDNLREKDLFRDMPEELQKKRLDMYPSKQFLSNTEKQNIANIINSKIGPDGSRITVKDLDKIKKETLQMIESKYNLSKTEEKELKNEINNIVDVLGYGRIGAVPTAEDIQRIGQANTNAVVNALTNEISQVKDLQKNISKDTEKQQGEIINMMENNFAQMNQLNQQMQNESNTTIRDDLGRIINALAQANEELNNNAQQLANNLDRDLRALNNEIVQTEERIKRNNNTELQNMANDIGQQIGILDRKVNTIDEKLKEGERAIQGLVSREGVKLSNLIAQMRNENDPRKLDELRNEIRAQKNYMDEIFQDQKKIVAQLEENKKDLTDEMKNLRAKMEIEGINITAELQNKFDELNQQTLTGNNNNNINVQNQNENMDDDWQESLEAQQKQEQEDPSMLSIEEMENNLKKAIDNIQGKNNQKKVKDYYEDVYENYKDDFDEKQNEKFLQLITDWAKAQTPKARQEAMGAINNYTEILRI